MGFFRENGLRFLFVFAGVILMTIIFTFIFAGSNKKATNYFDMQEKLKTAAIKYGNSNSSILPKKEGTLKKINLDTLINAKKIKQLYAFEDSNVACTGYVTVQIKKDKYVYTPYIKCGKYFETKTIGDYIIDNEPIQTDKQGLYNYNGTYVFRGENPNNYVALSNKLYRIIEINSDGEVKIIGTEKTKDTITWDDRYNSEKEDTVGINLFAKSRLKDSLNEIYNSEYFTDSDREKIVAHDLCVGKKSLSDGSMDGTAECSVKEPDQYVGLIQVNEYSRASLDEMCTSSLNLECQNYNFLENDNSIRTQTAVLDNTYQIYYIISGEVIPTRCSNNFYPYPVVYLDKDTLYSSGDGSQEHPYIVK